MFNFRLINLPDGNQVIDRQLKTPENSLSPEDLIEYIEIDKRLAVMDRMQKKQKKEKERKQKITYKLFHTIACMCGIM